MPVAPRVILCVLISALLFAATPAHAQVIPPSRGGTGTSTAPTYGKVLVGGKSGEYELVATSTLGSAASVSSVFGRTGAVTAQSGDYTTSLVTEGSNLYYTAARALASFISNLAATTSVDSITTLNHLSLPYSQLTGTPDLSSYLTGVTANSPLSGSGTVASHLTLSTTGTWSGNAGTATALAANGTNCSAGNYALGVDASGNSEGCTAALTNAGDWAGTWQTFSPSHFQTAGSYLTALTGDITASGPGSAASTLATVNSNIGSFTNANITVNAKGLITAASNGSAGGTNYWTSSGGNIFNNTGAIVQAPSFAATSTSATSTIALGLNIQGFTVATTTTVCIYPEQCQYQVAQAATNADVVINAAYTALSNAGGGALHIKAGTYTLNEAMKVPSNILTYGDGPATIIKVNGVDNPTNGHRGIWVDGTTNKSNIVIENLQVDGTNQAGQSGAEAIDIKSVGAVIQNIKILNNTFTNITGFGIFADANYSGGIGKDTNILIQGNTMYCHSFQDCIGGGPGENPDSIASSTQYAILNNTIIKDTSGGGSDYNCVDVTGGQSIVMQDNFCNGILQAGNESNPNKAITISNNTVDEIPGASVAGQIVVDNSHATANGVPVQFNIENNTLRNGNIEILGDSTNPSKSLNISGNLVQMAPSSYTFYSTSTAAIAVDNAVSPTLTNNGILPSGSGTGITGVAVTNSTGASVSQNTVLSMGVGINLYSGSGNQSVLNHFVGDTVNEQGAPNILSFLSGFFGIGTSTPYAALSVVGNLVLGAATAGGTPGDLYLPKLGAAAGAFLAVDPLGKVIATTTPSGGGGTVTAVSVASANGFTGSSSGGATPALTLATSITGLLKGNGTAISTAALSDFPTIAANTVLANNTSGTAAPTAIATSSLFALGNGLTQSSAKFQQKENRSFTYATSTAWTGTTTIALGVGYGETWNNVQCYTDVGTLNVDFYYASTHMFSPVDMNASTTNGTVSVFTNPTPTAGNKLKVDIGTPATAPKTISCTVNDTN